MILILLIIMAVLIAVIFAALLLPMKLYFSASGGSDVKVSLSGRIMLFNGLAGGGIKFENRCLRIIFFFGPLQVISIKATSAVRHLREKRKAKTRQKHVKAPEKVKKEDINVPRELPQQVESWLSRWEKYKKYSSIAMRAIREVIRFDRCRIRLIIGFGDPSLTGKTAGLLFALNGVLPKTFTLQPEWDFSKRVFDGEADLKLTFRSYLFWIYLMKLVLLIRSKSEDTVVFSGQTLKTQEA
jgi:hypothetical protein